MNENQKKQWRERWLACINELTSFELQQRSWLDKTNTNPHWSFVEFMCSYFDDLAIDNRYEHQLQHKWITKTEFSIIEKWHDQLDKYDTPNNDDYNAAEILKDTKWQSIVEKGYHMKIELSKIISTSEKQILME
ncbi:hypothetical protein [Flammeovirga sp. OC4]|uniref:hypothetical protein n=1 Tax=Flammeovirga sp. OC4 TaxID=1382345 RepID=UPI0005C52933|nr:hypothetical protein [Flammeovirga sp. OC4]